MTVTVKDQPLGPLKPPGDTTGLFGVLSRRYLLKLLVQKELRVRYQASLLGLAWSYVKPLIRFTMYFLVLGYLLRLRGAIPDFALHIFSAMIMVHFFTETLNAGTKSVVKNKSLVRKMNVPREMFPVASLLVTGYHAGPQYVILLIGCLLSGWSPDLTALAAGVLALAIVFTFSLAIALAFSALNVFFRDFGNFVETIGILVTWSTPMLYPWDFVERVLGPTLEWIYLCNPVAVAVLLNERAFWIPAIEEDTTGFMPDDLLLRGGVTLLVCLVLVAVGQRIFSRLEFRFAEQM